LEEAKTARGRGDRLRTQEWSHRGVFTVDGTRTDLDVATSAFLSLRARCPVRQELVVVDRSALAALKPVEFLVPERARVDLHENSAAFSRTQRFWDGDSLRRGGVWRGGAEWIQGTVNGMGASARGTRIWRSCDGA